eukprot:3855972-Rhodomonas_salina.1
MRRTVCPCSRTPPRSLSTASRARAHVQHTSGAAGAGAEQQERLSSSGTNGPTRKKTQEKTAREKTKRKKRERKTRKNKRRKGRTSRSASESGAALMAVVGR